MRQVCQIGLDIAKEYVQAHGVDKNGKVHLEFTGQKRRVSASNGIE